jgi:hypothetical protein
MRYIARILTPGLMLQQGATCLSTVTIASGLAAAGDDAACGPLFPLLCCCCVCRRFRALKLWFTMRMYGAEKLQELVRHHIALGEWLAEQVKQDNRCAMCSAESAIVWAICQQRCPHRIRHPAVSS